MIMMLTFAPENRELWIQRIKGKDEVKKFLSNLGFVEGAKIIVINQVNGNLIVNVKDTRVAIGRELSYRVMVCDKEG
jgi:ferrous iron transport protein A